MAIVHPPKQCRRCQEIKDAEHFDIYQHKVLAICKECRRERNREYYIDRRADIKEWLYNYLSENNCVDCNESDPMRLEFDHKGEKQFDIGKVLVGKSKSIDDVKAEVAKCDVRCANCHKVKTHKEQNTWKYRMHLERESK